MMQVMNEQEIVDNLPLAYRFLYYRVRDEFIIPNEHILFGAYFCRSEDFAREESLRRFEPISAVSTISGAVFVSNFRYFLQRNDSVEIIISK